MVPDKTLCSQHIVFGMEMMYSKEANFVKILL